MRLDSALKKVVPNISRQISLLFSWYIVAFIWCNGCTNLVLWCWSLGLWKKMILLKHCNFVNLIWNRHGLKCSRIWKLSGNFIKSVEIFWAEIYWGRLFLGPNLVLQCFSNIIFFHNPKLQHHKTRLVQPLHQINATIYQLNNKMICWTILPPISELFSKGVTSYVWHLE
jgi:hypothetical protein